MADGKQIHLDQAVSILRRGGLVAFPTETVYGLGADATNGSAIERIFAAKGRPSTNPLIVHVADESVARRYAAHWPENATKLARAFWPGPLTIVVAKTESIVPQVSAGLNSVGLRVPAHPLALALLKDFDGPVAAPSANASGRISPTTAAHVQKDLAGKVDLILDGGPCEVGIESTVLDLSGTLATILRPGGVSREQIEAVVGQVRSIAGVLSTRTPASSPGLAEVHYSPKTPMFRFNAGEWELIRHWLQKHRGQCTIILATTSPADLPGDMIQMPSDPLQYARLLYAALHQADDQDAAAIWVEMPPDLPAWSAVRDRLRRASKLP